MGFQKASALYSDRCFPNIASEGVLAPICYENHSVNSRYFHAVSIEACFISFTSKNRVIGLLSDIAIFYTFQQKQLYNFTVLILFNKKMHKLLSLMTHTGK